MSEVGKPAIIADRLDGRIGNRELFGGKIHTQFRHQVGQCFMQAPLHRSVYMVYIPFRQVRKAAYALLKQGWCGITSYGVVQPGGYFLIGRQVIVIQQ